MKISIERLISNLTARGRASGSRFAWWSRWFPPPTTVDANRFQGTGNRTLAWPTASQVTVQGLRVILS